MSFINYDNIIEYVEAKIAAINTLSATEASLVAAMANLLAGRNNPPSNMAALETYLQNRESLVDESSLVKDVTLLLGASLPSKNTVWRMQEFLADGTFIVPDNIAGGLVYITGCGGGGSGYAAARNTGSGGLATGGAGGFYVEKFPVSVTAGESVSVVIGAGGASVVLPPSTSSTEGNDGGDSIFKSLVIKGGQGGQVSGISGPSVACPIGGFLPGYYGFRIDPSSTSIFSGDYVHGESSSFGSCGKPRYLSASSRVSGDTGGAAGYFGSGTDAVSASASDATATNALPNTGAGGGAAAIIYPTVTRDRTATSGAGGSGRIIVEWQEFV